MLAERAKAFIVANGFQVYDTPEGLVGLMPCMAATGGDHSDDRYFEEATVFPVYFEQDPIDGFAVAHVAGRDVRQWLGY
ncbi:hypothetical protein [Aminobacter sp. HY435]|uniref:hypothetical protein n=1 Tax=Aminobacter sp. HY435 TaxID=2970917 RepID=UPI0022B971DE|nr:hypothetical protein [Aminobacter sp. HY435]